jgi:hypothetical protein
MIAGRPVLVPVFKALTRAIFSPKRRQQNWLLLLSPEPMVRGSRFRWEGAMRKPALSQREIPPEALDWSLRCLSCSCFFNPSAGSRTMGRGLLLWILGIPLPVIILLYVFHVI